MGLTRLLLLEAQKLEVGEMLERVVSEADYYRGLVSPEQFERIRKQHAAVCAALATERRELDRARARRTDA